MDVFPHDHPLLDYEGDDNEIALEMSETLTAIVKNSSEN
jgi:hypothetical protein